MKQCWRNICQNPTLGNGCLRWSNIDKWNQFSGVLGMNLSTVVVLHLLYITMIGGN